MSSGIKFATCSERDITIGEAGAWEREFVTAHSAGVASSDSAFMPVS